MPSKTKPTLSRPQNVPCDCGAPSSGYVNPDHPTPKQAIATQLYIDPTTRKSYSICRHGNAFEYEQMAE